MASQQLGLAGRLPTATRWLPACLLLLVPVPLLAQDAQPWSTQITPYVWASGIDGEITPFSGAPSIAFERSFSDLLEDSDGAFFISGFARRERLVLLGDFSTSSSSKEGRIPPGLPAEGELRQRSLTFALGWRAVDRPGMTLDVLGGVRHWNVRSSVAVPLVGISRSPEDSFTDPILALRANIPLGQRWSTLLYVDAGGVGVGSDHTHQFVGTLNFQASERFYLSGGYRRLDVDYASGGTRANVTLDGPLLGVTWRF